MCMIHAIVNRHIRSTMSSQHKRPLCWIRRQNGEKPQPPRVPLVGVVKGGRLSKILESASSTTTIQPRDTWSPILNYESHLSLLKAQGVDDENIDKIRARHIKYYEKNPLVEHKPLPDYSIPFTGCVDDETVVKTTTNEDGTVSKTTIENPFINFYNSSNTLDDYVDMYTKAGCSDDLINTVRQKFGQRARVVEEASVHFDRVMSRYSGKSTTKKKKATLRSRFSKQLKTVAIKVDDLKDDMGAEVADEV